MSPSLGAEDWLLFPARVVASTKEQASNRKYRIPNVLSIAVSRAQPRQILQKANEPNNKKNITTKI